MNHESTTANRGVFILLALLFGLPLSIAICRLPGVPTAEFFCEHATFNELPSFLERKLSYILFVPLGALLVVLVRLTLGLRSLGPFRSILLAAAFHIVGILSGLVFLVATTAIVVGLRPGIRSLKLPYFGWITLMLSTVSILMVGTVMVGQWLGSDTLRDIVYLPMVVLCLIADAFARTTHSEGLQSASFRGGITVAVAALLAAIGDSPVLTQTLLAFPELLIAHVGGIVFVSRFLNWRLLDWLNPTTKQGDLKKSQPTSLPGLVLPVHPPECNTKSISVTSSAQSHACDENSYAAEVELRV